MGRPRKYNTEEERKSAHREASRRWRNRNPDYDKEYQAANKDKISKYQSEFYSTKFGRANNLLNGYKYMDREKKIGTCTLTTDWIVKHIFSQPCHYCGKTDWRELGCDRIDNALPHTPENVVPCCWECNRKKRLTPYDEYLKLIGKI